jgi:hypothetical protein
VTSTYVIITHSRFGREETLDREMKVTSNPYVGVLETDKDQYSTGDSVEIVAKVSDIESVPVRDKKIYLTVSPAGTKLEKITDSSGMAQFSLKMPASYQTVTLNIDGVNQSIASTSLNWIEPKVMSSHIKKYFLTLTLILFLAP